MNYIGIDPGLKGGVAAIMAGELTLWPMPTIGDSEYDIWELKKILEPFKGRSDIMVTFERQHAMPGQGLTSAVKTGTGYGILMGLIAGMDIQHNIIPAAHWQKRLFVGRSAKLDTKEKSEIIAKRLYPMADFRRTSRSKKGHDGLYDATCLAHFGKITAVYANQEQDRLL